MRFHASSSWCRSGTTSQCSPSDRTGNPNWSPSGTPYSPWLTTASECQSPHGVGVRMLMTESITALAARSEERRVGKECRGRWGADDVKTNDEHDEARTWGRTSSESRDE